MAPRNSRLALLGRQRSDSEALQKIAASLSSGTDSSDVVLSKKLTPLFPDWIETVGMTKPNDEISTDEARAELAEYVGVAKAFGRGQANIFMALTQILNEALTGNCEIEGVPPIESWQDIATILRMMEQSGSGYKSWGEALGVSKILHLLEVQNSDSEA